MDSTKQKKRVFEGIKVADFTWAATGPQVGRTLAEHGATVIRIESHRKPDLCRVIHPFMGKPGINRSPFSAILNTNKYGISVDLTTPEGEEIARKLIKWADVVSDSFTPGTMKKLGLDYDEARKIRPGIIYFSTCSQGQYGPHALLGVYGIQTAPVSGFAMVTGYPDRDPVVVYGAYTDYVSPWSLVSYLAAALCYRRKTGKGVYLDHSQCEAALAFLAPTILDYTVNGRVANRTANRDPIASPCGAYPCKGEDRWIAIAVTTDEEWENFCQVIGGPEWTRDPMFATLTGRKENEDKLDSLIGEWTVHHTPEEIMTWMQAKGVPAGVVQTMEDLHNNDLQLKYREFFVRLNHTEMGTHSYYNEAARFSKTPVRLTKAAPCLGEDNEFVYKEILGMTDDDIADLLIKGVITTEDDIPAIGSTY